MYLRIPPLLVIAILLIFVISENEVWSFGKKMVEPIETTEEEARINETDVKIAEQISQTIDNVTKHVKRLMDSRDHGINLEDTKNIEDADVKSFAHPGTSKSEIFTNDSSTSEVIRSRTKEDVEPREEDFLEAADFGIQAMNDLYSVKEPKLYSMGLYLSSNNPARYVAAFNQQTEEAKQLAKFGYAAIEAAKKFRSKFPDLLRQASIQPNIDKSSLRQQCPRKGIPQCPPASLRYRTTDGSCNNHKHLWWGSAMSTMQRFLPAVYDDGIETIRRSVTGGLLPSARQISDYIHEERDVPLVSITHMLMQWGQFVDHDITATGQSRAFNGSVPQCCMNGGQGFQPPEFMHPECLPIAVHPQDSHLSRLGVRCLEFVRSGPAPREDCEFGAREQLSQVTSFIDASTVYSSSARQSDSLRIFRNGLMQYGKIQSRRPVLPRDDSDLCRRGSLSSSCFRAGDGRLSEQPALTSLHVVFLRLHNRLATQLSALNQHWSDEKIFQESRRIVGAIIQHITYREFLPIVLGPDVMKIFEIELLRKGYYEGYDQSVDPNVANGFATAAYRFGHSLVQHSFVRFDRNHQPIFNNVTIHEEFSNPANLETVGSVDRILLGLINQPAQKRDVFISEELTNHLFQTPGFPFGMDLASLNIQRGRDHGIPPFVDWRPACALSPIRTWKDLERIMSPDTAKKFRDLYAAVEDIDLFTGGLAEKPVIGGLVGPTFACIIAQQFRSLRKGDRFWYENPFVESGFTPPQLQQIRKVTLAQILCRTTDNIDTIQPFVMLAPDTLRNQRLSCQDPILEQINLDAWIEQPFQKRESTDSHEKTEEKDEINNEDAESRASQSASKNKPNQRLPQPQRQKPVKTRINQQNRITVKRPLGPNENLTIVVHNNAVNAPVFVSDSIYGSHIQLNQYPHQQRPPISNDGFGSYRPRPPFQPNNPYFPHSFDDPSNPNPPNYGFNSKPSNNYFPNNDFFSYNIPNLPGMRPTTDQNDFTQSQQSYFTTKRPSNRPTFTPQTDNTGFTTSQQESHYTTRKPRPPFLPTSRPLYIENSQEIETSYPSRPVGSYSSNNNRPSHETNYNSDDPYSNLEPNNSDRDQYNPDYRPRPTKVPSRPTSQNTPNRRYIDSKPQNQNDNGYPTRPSYGSSDHSFSTLEYVDTNYQTKYPTKRPQVDNWHSTSIPQNSYSRPTQTDFSNKETNVDQENSDRPQSPYFLHTHTTISNIQIVPFGEPDRHTIQLNFDSELPRPIVNVQNRESEDDPIENRATFSESSKTERNFLEPNETSSDVEYRETIDWDTNARVIKEEVKLTTTATIVINNDEINLSSTSKPEVEENDRTLGRISDDAKMASLNSNGNEDFYKVDGNELPRPMRLIVRHGS